MPRETKESHHDSFQYIDISVSLIINDPSTNWMTAPENKLHRPVIKFHIALLWVFFVGIGCLVQSCVFIAIIDQFGFKIAGDSLYCVRLLTVFPFLLLINGIILLKYALIWLIRLYQRYARSDLRLRCVYDPSCSEYSILALKKYGLIRGICKSHDRYKRCHPPGGVDYP